MFEATGKGHLAIPEQKTTRKREQTRLKALAQVAPVASCDFGAPIWASGRFAGFGGGQGEKGMRRDETGRRRGGEGEEKGKRRGGEGEEKGMRRDYGN